MASNKNQHFVPRCYLRPFSSDSARKTINLYNIDRSSLIYGAPIKSQCSRDYFYGSDPRLESAIQAVEGGYAAVLPSALEYNKPVDARARVVLPRFWFLQHTRTEAASQRMVAMSAEADSLIDHEDQYFKVEIKQAVKIALGAYAEMLDALDDLKIVLARNRTQTPFITSDDPAIMVNRWLHNNRLVMGPGYGMGAAGLICILPLSPNVCCIFYDDGIYSIPNSHSWIDIRSSDDIDSINNMQYLNCAANLYFHDSKFSELFDSLRSTNHDSRPEARHRVHYAVKSKSENGVSTYSVVDKSAIPEHTEALIHMETIRISPEKWPNFLKWRPNGSYFSNDTGVGHIRQRHAPSRLGDRPYTKRRTGH